MVVECDVGVVDQDVDVVLGFDCVLDGVVCVFVVEQVGGLGYCFVVCCVDFFDYVFCGVIVGVGVVGCGVGIVDYYLCFV